MRFRTPLSKQGVNAFQELLKSLLSEFFITLGDIKLENIPLGTIWNLRTVCSDIDYRWPSFHKQFNWNYLKSQTSMIKLFRDQHFQHFEKGRSSSGLHYIRYYWLQKILSLTSLKSYVLGYSWALNVLTSANTGEIWSRAILFHCFNCVG